MAAASDRRLGLGGVAQLLGVPRLTVWWWVKTGQLPLRNMDKGRAWWSPAQIHEWALEDRTSQLSGRVPVTAWPSALDLPRHKAATFLGAVDAPHAVAQRWNTAVGELRLVWPLADATRRPNMRDLVQELAPRGDGAVVLVLASFFQGPELKAALPGLPERTYELRWRHLPRVLGTAVPYWPSRLRDRQLLRDWRPDNPSVTAMAVSDLDTTPLLRMASTFNEEHPSSRTLVNLARLVHKQAAGTAAMDLELLRDTPGMDASQVVVAAEPMDVPDAELSDVDPTQRREGWLRLLERSDALAARCVAIANAWNAGADLPFGNPEQINPPGSVWAQEWIQRLVPTKRTAAFELLDRDRECQTLTDPKTDTPAIREHDGTVRLAVPQRLFATTPLAELILDEPIWVRTADGTLYPAPKDSYYGISWGYGGSGPGSLALLVHALLNDINAFAPGGISGAPEGLDELFERPLRHGTVLTRKQLEAARRGEPTVFLVDADEEDPESDLDDE